MSNKYWQLLLVRPGERLTLASLRRVRGSEYERRSVSIAGWIYMHLAGAGGDEEENETRVEILCSKESETRGGEWERHFI